MVWQSCGGRGARAGAMEEKDGGPPGALVLLSLAACPNARHSGVWSGCAGVGAGAIRLWLQVCKRRPTSQLMSDS